MIHRDQIYPQHILECIGRIEENTVNGREAFLASHTPQVMKDFYLRASGKRVHEGKEKQKSRKIDS
jgi:hypothetical protein